MRGAGQGWELSIVLIPMPLLLEEEIEFVSLGGKKKERKQWVSMQAVRNRKFGGGNPTLNPHVWSRMGRYPFRILAFVIALHLYIL